MFCISLLPSNLDPNEDGDNNPATFREGTTAWFRLTGSRAPTSNVDVFMEVTNTVWQVIPVDETGDQQVTFETSFGTAVSVEIPTLKDDGIDELDGTITITLEDDEGGSYTVGSPSSVTLTVKDKPPAPTGLRANGDLGLDGANGKVTLRWNPVVQPDREGGDEPAGAVGNADDLVRYKVYSAPVECTAPDMRIGGELEYDCVAGDEVRHPDATDTTAKIRLGGHGGLYRVWVTAMIVDESDPSDHAFVVPTVNAAEIPNVNYVDTVASIPIRTYRHEGRFKYSICDPAEAPTKDGQPRQLPGWFKSSVKGLIAKWDEAVVWQGNGRNIITSDGEFTPNCEENYNVAPAQVYLVNDDVMLAVCRNNITRGCWHFSEGAHLTRPAWIPQALLIRDAPDLNAITTGDCTHFAKTVVHEAGHAWGLGGHNNDEKRNHAQIAESAMAVEPVRRSTLCYPTAYDAAAIMANYQSR